MIEPTAADIGRKVVYVAYTGAPREEGFITSLNERYVFVRYGMDGGSKATPRSRLEWLSPPLASLSRTGGQ